MAAVQIRGLHKAFGAQVVLDGIDLDIDRDEFVVLLGPSGTGKTTLLRILAGLDEADGGSVRVAAARTLVFQEPRLVESKRVLGNVTLGQPRSAGVHQAAVDALREVGLADKERAWPTTLSGGEAQRVALARALVRQPELLLLDEPFASLDALTRLQMQDLVADLVARHHPGALLVTHDVDEAVRLADRVLVLRDGRFAVDLRIDLPHPRDRNDPASLRHRQFLLAELGVAGPVDATAFALAAPSSRPPSGGPS